MINFKILTLFPEMFPGPLAASVTGTALKNNLWSIEAINIRDYAKDERGTVDDIPYGGGAGMVLKADIVAEAIEKNIDEKQVKIIYLSPRGKLLTQQIARELAQEKEIILLCGRYEGVDQRVLDELEIEEISIGDYVLSGGEIAAYPFIDAVLRNINGVLGDENSLQEESFDIDGKELLEYPHYTRPASWRGREVPQVLISGHHKNIKSWRLEKAIELTKLKRDDLYKKFLLQKNN
ncbi:MAG: tRNA (guanosine(37)-N1)-methyltransferase TrmD [Rickettsiales bacterium]|nr:tRNA (guanosine(37)-N1)-methyltransferase TrmD [Rickettsiales bacterium]